MWENSAKKSQFYNWTTLQLSLSDLNRVKIIATNVEFPTGAEMDFFDLIDELPLLPSSEFFYLIDDNDDIMVKQGVSVDDYWQHNLQIESHLKNFSLSINSLHAINE